MKKYILSLTIMILSFVLFAPLSFAVIRDIENRELPENYTAILIQLPGIFHQPAIWNEKYTNPTKTLTEYMSSDLIGKSVPEIVKRFGGEIFFNNSEYSYAYVKLLKENYGNLTNTLKLLGFDVKNVSWGRALLNESRPEIGLPYYVQGDREVLGTGARIAIIDTGIDCTHPDFDDCNADGTGKIHFWGDLIAGRSCCTDEDGHGTHVASIAAGTGAAFGGRYKGVAPNASLLIWRFSRYGYATLGDLAHAINDAVSLHPDVISVSFGWTGEQLLKDYNTPIASACIGIGTNDVVDVFNAIQNAVNNGIPVVFAAGNEGPGSNTIDFPACIQDVIAVGMTFKRDYEGNLYSLETNWDSSIGRAPIHVTANEGFDKEWFAFNITSGEGFSETWRYYTWSGFIKVFNTNNPTVSVNVEGQYKTKGCWAGDQISWNPGNADKGDKFWSWVADCAPYGGVEVYGKVHTNWGWCFLWLDVWGTTYVNTYQCSGTPLSCNTFDEYRNSCGNQLGCYWCGCGEYVEGILHQCYPDKPQEECYGCWYDSDLLSHCYWWAGCEGEPKACEERIQEFTCGTPATTGCSGYWSLDDTIVRIFSTKRPSLKGLPVPDSSRGPSPNGLIKPDVTAPGFDVCAARADGTTMGDLDCGNDNYVRASGTSMATPMVAGLIALLKEIKPDASYDEIINSIKFGDILIDYHSDFSEYHRGFGRINISKAAECINCNLRDGWYCNGDIREYRDYYCDSSLGCTYSVTQSNNCNNYDIWYCDASNRCGSPEGDTREYLDFRCVLGYCVGFVTPPTDCRCDAYDSDGGQAFTVPGTCIDYNGCSGGNCQSSSYTDTCINSNTLKEYYVAGTGDSAYCAYIYKNCSDLGYYCSVGKCRSSGGGGGGGCPTLFVWNGSEFEKENVLNIHASSDITLDHKIEKRLGKGLLFYSLQLRELDEFTSHIDQVKLYAIDSKGKKHEFPLIYAYHSKLGFILLQLLFNDGIRVDQKPNEIIDLKFLPTTNDIEYFVFEINGFNPKYLLV